MTDGKNNRDRSPKHIKDVILEAQKTWLKKRVEEYKQSPEFKETFDSCKSIEILFIYIDGDPQYIRTIFLN